MDGFFRILLFLTLFINSFAFAGLSTRQAHTDASFVRELETLQPGTNWLALKLVLDPEWHSYWRNPGDSASAPIFDFELPEGVVLKGIHFPKPSRFALGPLWSMGYAKETMYLFEVEVAETLSEDQDYTLVLDAEWVVCKVECVPGIYKFEMPVKYSSSAAINTADAGLFADYKKRLPLENIEPAHLSESHVGVQLSAEASSFQDYEDIFPFHNEKVNNTPARELKAGRFLFEKSKLTTKNESVHKFLVTYRGAKRSQILQVMPKPQPLLLMLGFAVLGGLILNLMPCVFPVLALKVYSLARAPEKQRGEQVISQLVYALGVLLSFWVLAGIIVGLRAAGSNLGWGFHLQSPWFVGAMMLLFFGMALAFLDILPLGLDRLAGTGQQLAQKKGPLGSFFTGVLAVVVASPCTAPFMGAAMGYALTQGAPTVFLIFSGLGLGLALPFLLFAIVPQLAAVLPRPGVWMQTFKKVMAVPLLGTALWLGWVLSLQLQAMQPKQDHYQIFSEEKVQSELAAGHPVFINFTAAWCISCQVNEQVVFAKPSVQTFFADNKITQFKADWTNRDDTIGAVLKRYGRAGVPLYLVFKDVGGKPLVLPELLTEDMFINRLSEFLKDNGKDTP